MARNYIQFITNEYNDVEISPDLYAYYSQPIGTQLPSYVNSKKLIQIDSNFECGNVDSAYLVSESEYNILLKVDTNTRGGTHWFNFKVLLWRPGQVVTFNILNMVRDLSRFYGRGMNIWSRTESLNGAQKSEWTVNKDLTEVIEV